MSVIFELSTTRYQDDRLGVKRALSHVETLCGTPNGYSLGQPEERAGWTFFKLKMGPDLHEGMEKKFSDMIGRYRWGRPEEKFRRFVEEYLQARGCSVNVRAVTS